MIHIQFTPTFQKTLLPEVVAQHFSDRGKIIYRFKRINLGNSLVIPIAHKNAQSYFAIFCLKYLASGGRLNQNARALADFSRICRRISLSKPTLSGVP